MTQGWLYSAIKTGLRLFISLVDRFVSKSPQRITFYCSPIKDLDTNTLTLLYEATHKPPLHVACICTKTTSKDRLPKEITKAGYTSIYGQWLLMRSGIIVFDHSAPPGILPNGRQCLNIWHGTPIKKIRRLANTSHGHFYLNLQEKSTSATICSSECDKMVMSQAFNINMKNVWLTGLPRNDILFTGHKLAISKVINQQQLSIQKIRNGKRLYLYAPTYRQPHLSSCYPFSDEELHLLSSTLSSQNIILGIRLHSFATNIHLSNTLPENIVLLNSNLFPDSVAVLNEADLLITDYSSIWVDFLLTNKPIVGFFYDQDEYRKTDNGLIYPLEDVFPGYKCHTFQELNQLLSTSSLKPDAAFYKTATDKFHNYKDGKSTSRIMSKLGIN